MSTPQGLFMVTNAGQRIPIDVKLYCADGGGTRYWLPVIEGDLKAVMPSVIGFDGPALHAGEALAFPVPGPGWDTEEWAQTLMANSQHVFAWYHNFDRPAPRTGTDMRHNGAAGDPSSGVEGAS